ncbi:hypothetical protein [Streptomyces sp. MK5]|uniref:VG15 protein n=1 Tax=Streptomyces sp. MK5 TaxID=3064253 RepID=UPI0027418B96|nr:hypothetical protein [Streptomyces sp. MK5]
MTVPTVAQQHQQQRAAQAAATATAVRTVWNSIDPDNLEQSWLARVPLAAEIIRRGQMNAALTAETWLDAEVGPGEGQLIPEAAAAATGDLVLQMLYPLLVAWNRISRGMSVAVSILSGATFLEIATRSLVSDAGRIADMAGMVARPRVVSYVRVVELPACARCVLLAGREYSFSEGFLRHPQCDCTMAPKRPGDGWTPQLPEDIYAQMSPAEQRRAFGEAGVQAIDAGADIGQVVNARRGMTTVTRYRRTVQATSEGTTRRGLYASRRAKFAKAAGVRFGQQTGGRDRTTTPRLMPEEIYRLADDRDHAIRLLKKYGYIV